VEKKQDIPPRNPAVYGRSDPTVALSDVEFKSHFSTLYFMFLHRIVAVYLHLCLVVSVVLQIRIFMYIYVNVESGY
jgi:hypothetical protein